MGFLTKGVLIYLLLAIAIAFAAPHIIFSGSSPSDATVLSWFNVKIDANNTVYYDTIPAYGLNGSALTSNMGMTTLPTPTSGGTSFFQTFIDPLVQTWNWVITLGKVVFSPIIIFTHPDMTGAPISLLFIIGLPIVVLFLLGLIIWVRSGEA
jgi:hypothetical protein